MFKTMKAAALIAAPVFLGLAGCTTVRLTEPPQTASEQLLISTAVDHVVAQLAPRLPPGSKVFVDPQYFDTAPADAVLYPKYTIGAIRDRLLREGVYLADDRKTADIILEPRSGAQSIDHHTTLIGIPSFPVPIPFAGNFTFPQVAFYEKDQQTGISKLAITAYSEKTGTLAASSGPALGLSEKTHYVLLLFFSWTDTDILPKALQKRDE